MVGKITGKFLGGGRLLGRVEHKRTGRGTLPATGKHRPAEVLDSAISCIERAKRDVNAFAATIKFPFKGLRAFQTLHCHFARIIEKQVIDYKSFSLPVVSFALHGFSFFSPEEEKF